MFNQPSNSGGGWLKPAEHNNHLILITKVHEFVKRYDDLRKEDIDEAVVDFVDLDAPTPEHRERVNVSHKGITSRLTVGTDMVLGRIGQVTTKSGFQAWALLPFTEGTDDRRAEQWVMAHRPTFTQAPAPAAPAAATPAPAPQQAAAYTPPPAPAAPADEPPF